MDLTSQGLKGGCKEPPVCIALCHFIKGLLDSSILVSRDPRTNRSANTQGRLQLSLGAGELKKRFSAEWGLTGRAKV